MLVAPTSIEVREYDLPAVLSDGSALLRVEAGGMCGTDAHQYFGRTGAAGHAPPYPVILGHEPVGVIERITPAAARAWGVAEGDRVVAEPTTACGSCRQCREGQRTLCLNRAVYSYLSTAEPPSLWGAYAEHMVLRPGSVVHAMPSSVAAEDAVFFNPLAAGLSWALDVGGARLGDDVLVIGPGQRGLASIVALREAGAGRIIVIGRESDRRKFQIARQLGATHVFEDINPEVAQMVREVTDGGVHVALDYTPAADALTTAITACRPGGTVVFVARHGEVGLPTDEILAKALTIRCSVGADSRAYAQAVRILASGRHDLSALHTHRFGLSELDDAMKLLASPPAGESAIHMTVFPTLENIDVS